jgi:Na+/melibiose symporter-like transporter
VRPSAQSVPFAFGKTFVIGFGFLGISLLWSVYNDFVPILLQAGRPDFSKGAGVQGFALGTSATGLVMGLDNLAALFILPYIGGVSDRVRTRWGRRMPFIMIGAPIAALAFAAAPLTLGKPLWLFMASLIITLLAMDLFRTPVVSLMPDLTPPAHRSQANGIINFMGGLGGVIATLVGGKLFGVSPIAPFLLGAGGMMVALTILLLTVREPEPAQQTEVKEEQGEDMPVSGLLPSLFLVLKDRDRSMVFLLGAICFWFLGMSAFESWFSSYAIQRIGLETGQAVVLKSFFTLSVLGSALPCGALGAFLGRKRAILLGLLLLAGTLGTAYFVPTETGMQPLLVMAGFGWMMVVVNSLPLVLDFAPAGRIGTYTGMYYLASQTASFVGPVVSGRLFEVLGNNYQILCVYSPVALLLAAALLLGVRAGKTAQSVPQR